MIGALLGLLALAAVPAGALRAEEARHFVYNITTDEAWAAGMALGQANVAASRGHSVTVFLNVRGVNLAAARNVQGTFGPAGQTPRELLGKLLAGGHTVLVCGTCMSVAGLEAADLIEGAQVSGPDQTFGALTVPGTVVMSY
jgi:predicted peroxiredoxin